MAIVLIVYLVMINLISWGVYGYDKHCAVMNKWRVPEITLLSLAAGGGALGALLAMYGFHHKTRHKKFMVCVPLFLTLQFLLLIIIL